MNKGANPMTLSIKVNEFAYVLHECVNGWAIFEKKNGNVTTKVDRTGATEFMIVIGGLVFHSNDSL